MIRFSELLSIVYCKATSAFDSSVLTVFIAAVLYRLNQVAKLMHSSDGSGCLLQASSDSQGARPIVTFPAKVFQPKRWLQLEYAVLTKKVTQQDNSFQRTLTPFDRTLWRTDHQRSLTFCSR